MNVLGKILVFLNLLFALAVGAFLLVDFQTRKNWKQAYEQLVLDTKVSRTNTDAQKITIGKMQAKMTEYAQKYTDEKSLRDKLKTDTDKQLADYKDKKFTAEETQNLIFLAISQKQKQLEKYQQENKTIADLLTKRDKQVLFLEQDKDKYFKEAQQALNDKDLAVSRLDSLQKTLSTLQLKLATETVKGDGGKGSTKVKGKFDPNPPPFYIKGTIEKVHPEDSGLVEISLGSDQGMAVGQTLETFRKSPAPKYLGMVQIVEVTAHNSVGRLIPNPYAPPVALKKGDEVASSLSSGY